MKLYTQKVECCGECPASFVRKECVVGPSHLHCRLSNKETKPDHIPQWCCLDTYEDPDGFIDGERKF